MINTEAKNNNTESKGKILVGTVVSTKMKDTVVVSVERFVKIPKYGKFIKSTKRYKAHDPKNTKELGSKVWIRECRPISKDKHFEVIADQN